ncbi:MAG: metallophosphoesterase [Candidatus Nanohalobium sp.]
MKAFAIGDDHGALADEDGVNLRDLVYAIEEEAPDIFLHLGDTAPKRASEGEIEDAYAARDSLVEYLNGMGIDYAFVPGNHDLAAAEKVEDGFTEPFASLENSEDYGLEEVESPVEQGYRFRVDGFDFVAVHAGLAGDTPYAGEDGDPPVDASFYFNESYDKEEKDDHFEFLGGSLDKNNRVMAELGIDVLVRGHEELPVYYEKNGKHVVTTDSFLDGHTIIDTDYEVPRIERRSLESSGDS